MSTAMSAARRASTAMAGASAAVFDCAPYLCDEHPERQEAFLPEFAGFRKQLLECVPLVRMVALVARRMREDHHDAALAQPVAVFENVGQRIEIMTKVRRQLQCPVELGEQG